MMDRTRRRRGSKPRLVLLVLSIALSGSQVQGFEFASNYVQQFRSKYRLALDQASNEVINGSPEKRSGSSHFLNIKEAPAKLIEARQHGQVSLKCEAVGRPAPVVTWYKNGQPLHQIPNEVRESNDESLGVTVAKLNLDCIDESDAGFYECVAKNEEQGNAMRVGTNIHVTSSQLATCQKSQSAAPKIVQAYQTYMTEMGKDARLKCHSNLPSVETTWIGPDETAINADSAKYELSADDGSLVIHDLDFNDMGVYVCTVSNRFGHDIAETFVYPVAPQKR